MNQEKSLTKTYILWDCENISPLKTDFSTLADKNYKLIFFVGAGQDLKEIKNAPDSELIKIKMQRDDALDFVLSFYVGTIVFKEKDISVRIVSNDKGFDALISHLEDLGIEAKRVSSAYRMSLQAKPSISNDFDKILIKKDEEFDLKIQIIHDYSYDFFEEYSSHYKMVKDDIKTKKELKVSITKFFNLKISPVVVNKIIKEMFDQNLISKREENLE